MCVQVAEALKKRPGAVTEYVEFEGCGHVPMDERPQEFVAAVTPFVDKILGQSLADMACAGHADTEGLTDAPDQPLQAVEMTKHEFDAIPMHTDA